MDTHLIKQAFDNTGYYNLYEQFHYQIDVTGLFDTVEQPLIIEHFLECYSFDPEQHLFFDEFAFHFRTFHYTSLKRELQSFHNANTFTN
ncbi:hypothetical protein [Peribacillus asahii]|uniref:hypothetical protein n=1 Tax=Peribacillus asahii TaxID=228899 RepID=UPI0037F7AC7F